MKKHHLVYSSLTVIVLGILFFSLKNSLIPDTKEVTQASTEKSFSPKYSFVYSHPFQKQTYLLSTDKGTHYKEKQIKVTDIFTIQLNTLKKDSLLLFPTHDRQYYQVDNLKNVRKKPIRDPLTFFQEDKNLMIKSYNISKDENLLEVSDKLKDRHYNLKFPTYLVSSFYDKDNIYVLNDVINEEKSFLRVINRNTGKIIRTVPLNSPASSIAKTNNNLILTTEKNLSIISTTNWKIKEIDYPAQNIMADQVYVKNNNLFISYGDYADGNAHLLVLNKSFKIIRNIDLNTPYTKSKFTNQNLYVLSQYEDDKKDGGKFTIVNLDNLKVDKQFALPKKDVKVQDFVVY